MAVTAERTVRRSVRAGHGLLSGQQCHLLGRELVDLPRHWLGAPCGAPAVVGQAEAACGLTIHSSRHRFAARLNSGVRLHKRHDCYLSEPAGRIFRISRRDPLVRVCDRAGKAQGQSGRRRMDGGINLVGRK